METLYKKRSENAFMLLTSIFIASLILTNLIGGKFLVIWGLPLSCSIVTYPITFLITDIISEIYGLKYARMLVWIGFLVSGFVTFLAWIAHIVPIATYSPIDSASFDQIFGLMPGFVFGSMVAYLTAQFVDVQIFEALRNLSGKKHLWLRNNASTMTSQLVDTIAVTTISLVLWPIVNPNSHIEHISFHTWMKIVVGQYGFKAFLALCDTPFIYAAVHLLKRWLGLNEFSS